MDKPQTIGLGVNGLVGTRVRELLSGQYHIIPLSRSTGVDITNKQTLGIINKYKDAKIVLHLAGKTDVDGCEKDKELGEEGEAWKINVEGTRNLAQVCKDLGKKIIFISTDFVFNGKKPKGEVYSEEDLPSPINWYGRTKYEGEKVIEKSGADFIILRIAYPYRAAFELKKDFIRAIKERLTEGLIVKAVTDHIFCPTFIDDLAIAIDVLIKNNAAGIYHAVGTKSLSPYEASLKIAEVFGLDKSLIGKTTREEFFAGRAPRPYNLNLKNGKITKLGIRMKNFEEGLEEIKNQISKSKNI